jgi:hypothetical protein
MGEAAMSDDLNGIIRIFATQLDSTKNQTAAGARTNLILELATLTLLIDADVTTHEKAIQRISEIRLWLSDLFPADGELERRIARATELLRDHATGKKPQVRIGNLALPSAQKLPLVIYQIRGMPRPIGYGYLVEHDGQYWCFATEAAAETLAFQSGAFQLDRSQLQEQPDTDSDRKLYRYLREVESGPQGLQGLPPQTFGGQTQA